MGLDVTGFFKEILYVFYEGDARVRQPNDIEPDEEVAKVVACTVGETKTHRGEAGRKPNHESFCRIQLGGVERPVSYYYYLFYTIPNK